MSQLHGDGINFSFFNLLWSKSTSNDDSQAPLRVPDTVVFLFGLPHQWYFTSKNGGPNRDQTMILRKRRTNLTLENIEEVFLDKASSRGSVGEDDVVAYFIEQGGTGSCNIEYFNARSLRKFVTILSPRIVLHALISHSRLLLLPRPTTIPDDFLQDGKTNKSGILQRFINPHGGRYNSQIRAMWTPTLCLQERRRTKQDLHDTRFALSERSITFDGPEIHSVSVPLRGTVLAGRIQSICTEISKHITQVVQEDTTSKRHNDVDNSFLGVARMVVNFKVDGNGRIWILWSDSVRLESMSRDDTSILSKLEPSSPLQGAVSEPLNMDTIVELPASTRLSQVPNHSTALKLDNKMKVASCPSCSRQDFDQQFQAVPYKTIMQHFEKTLEMLISQDESHPSTVWPPDDRFIRAAGGIGFGMLSSQLAQDREMQSAKRLPEESLTIPPVIRQIHPKLRAKGFQMHRNDPSFLFKTCNVCEDCFLTYAQLTSTSFMMTRPIAITDATAFEGSITASFPMHDTPKSKRVYKRNPDNDTTRHRFEKAPGIPQMIWHEDCTTKKKT